MIRKYFGEKAKTAKSSERGEAMPAAIVTAIISSMLLVGIASVMTMVLQSKTDSAGNLSLSSVVSNIDVSLRSDVTNASYITATAKLKQPTTRLLSPTDDTLTGVNMHVPDSSGQCKVISWSIDGTTVSRDLTVYQSTVNTDNIAKCDLTSPVVAKRTKVFAQNVNVDAPFVFTNQVGRQIIFTIASADLTNVNNHLDSELKAQNVQQLSTADFNNLNSLMTVNSYVPGFSDPTACVMNIPKNSIGACPPPETSTVAAAWNSLKIAKVSVAFSMSSASGQIAKRDISQNSTVPLYSSAAQAAAAVAASNQDNRPLPPTVTVPANVVLGNNYTINWNAGQPCPTNYTKTYNLYENNVLVNTTAGLSFTKNYTNSATQWLQYTVQIQCLRGALLVTSDPSTPAVAKVIPNVPALNFLAIPSGSNAALNSTLRANAACLYGTVPQYNIIQSVSTWGAPNTATGPIPNANIAINSAPFTVVEGAGYIYTVQAWCNSSFDKSTNASIATYYFTTVINDPTATAAAFTAPIKNAVSVPTNTNLTWNASTCATGTNPSYYATQNVAAGATMATPNVINNWNNNLSYTTANTEGNIVGYTVQSRCEGTAVASPGTAADSIRYTTVINNPTTDPKFTSPANGSSNIATNTTVSWSAATCAPSTTTLYYFTKNIDGGTALATPTVIDNWTTDLSYVTAESQGNSIGYTVMARCAGPNVSSAGGLTYQLNYSTMITSPSAPVFTSPANAATAIAANATVTWSSVVCPASTTAKYYLTKNWDSGAALATPTVIDNWTTDLSYVSANVEGDNVGYSIAARCDGPSLSSVPSATNTLKYTTVINAPTGMAWTAPTPANGVDEVSQFATLAWNAGCAPGTTVKYYTFKDMNGGAVIAPIIIDNWTTDTSYATSALQGYTVRYNAQARCDGPNLSSSTSPTVSVQYTTHLDAPGTTNAWNDSWRTVQWNAPGLGCVPESTLYYRVHQTKSDNNVVDSWTGLTAGTSSWLPAANTPGYPQWADVQAVCAGQNKWAYGAEGATTKWVEDFSISFGASQQWRRVNVSGSCPFATTVNNFFLYVAADGWGGARGTVGWIATDEGAHIADATAGGGGNTNWIAMNQTTNQQWDAAVTANTTYNWGYWGNEGFGATYNNSNSMTGTYWNASGWGNWAYWWTASCSSPYLNVYAKGGAWFGGGIRNAGDPGSWWNAQPNGPVYTTAGNDAVK